MIVHDVTQGSADWHALRANSFTASEAPAMAGVSKYQKRGELLKLKFTGEAPEVTPAQQRIFDKGHAAEAVARPIAERVIGEELYPCTATHDEHKWMLASFDGCTMLEDVIWEHKLINAELRYATVETLTEHYKVQMDQQLLVSGAERCLFMASDGTEDDCNWFWYDADAERLAKMVPGWDQFREDLDGYQPAPEAVAPQGEAPDSLPALSINLSGGVTASNLPDFKARALGMIDGIKTELSTDKDFADAESTVKFLQKGEKQLEASKKSALEQTASIDELFSTIDELRETMRQKRLHLNRLVKAEKENRRADIHRKANETFDAYLVGLGCPVEPDHTLDVAGAMRGKKTIATLQEAADTEVARAQVECQQAASQVKTNLSTLNESQGDYGFLFSDWRDLVQKSADDLQATIKARIADHKAAEEKRFEVERERIRQQEEAKARADAQRKADEEARLAREAAMLEARRQEEEAEQQKPAPEPAPPAVEREPLDTGRLDAAVKRGSEVAAPKTVTITVDEYNRLLSAQAELDALKAHGVDNWSGYDEAMAEVCAT